MKEVHPLPFLLPICACTVELSITSFLASLVYYNLVSDLKFYPVRKTPTVDRFDVGREGGG